VTPAERLAEQLAAPHTPDLWTYQRQRAWLGRITDADRRALQSAADRVLALLADHQWHAADEIRAAAAPSHTGLERLRELRNTHGFNIASRQVAGQCRVWEYRLAEDLPAAGGAE
jgi:hypothetical protein